MHFSTVIGLATLALGATAKRMDKRQTSLSVFKVYDDPANCSNSPSEDDYNTIISATSEDYESGACNTMNLPNGWQGVKQEAQFPQDYDFNVVVYVNDDCTGDSSTFNGRICYSREAGYKSWRVTRP